VWLFLCAKIGGPFLGIIIRLILVFTVIYAAALVVGIGLLIVLLRSFEGYLDPGNMEIAKSIANVLGLILMLVAAATACSWKTMSRLGVVLGPLSIRDSVKRNIWPISLSLSAIGTTIVLVLYVAAAKYFTGNLMFPGVLRLLVLFAIHAYLIHFTLSQPLKKSIQFE